MMTSNPATAPAASDFEPLSQTHAPAIVRQLYLGQLDLGRNWNQLLASTLLAWRRREMVRFLFIETKLTDGQIAWLFETTSLKILYFRMNSGIRKKMAPRSSEEPKRPRPPMPPPTLDTLRVREEDQFCRRWKLIFGDNFDRDDPSRPYHQLSIAEQRQVSRLAEQLAEEHNAHL